MPTNPSTTAFHDYFLKRQREILALTRALVETESPSGDDAGSKAVVSMLAAAARTINAVTTIDRIPSENYGENLRLQAFANGRNGAKTILILARSVLVLEPPASGGRVKTGRKGTGMFTMVAHGKAAHAGLEPEKGASAILEIARQIDQLHRMNNQANGISVNVGVVRGGTVSNVVPAEATAEVDLRFSSNEEGERAEAAILGLRSYDPRVELVVRGGVNRPPLERTERVLALYEQARRIAGGIGYELGEAQVGGASDGNFAAAVGATVLDGLGIDGDGAHATHEHILIDDIARRGALLAGLLATL
jgi:glutamate carboxypeptidase